MILRKKILLALVCGIVAASVMGCGKSHEADEGVETEIVTETENEAVKETDDKVEDEDINETVVLTGDPMYADSSELRVASYPNWAEDLAGTIVDASIYKSSWHYAITDDGSIYRADVTGYTYEQVGTVEDASDRFAIGKMGIDSYVLQHADGTYTLYDGNLFADPYSFECENLVSAFYYNHSYYILYQGSDGALRLRKHNYNSGEESEYSIIVDESNAYLYSDSAGGEYSGAYVNFECITLSQIQATKSDGDTYVILLSQMNTVGDSIKLSTSYASGVASGASAAKLGSSKSGWVKDNTLTIETGLLEREQTEITLPDGYTAEDVVDMYLKDYDEYYILIMDDGNIMCYENEEWSQKEDMSEMYQEEHIIRFMETATDIFVFCDDGYVYSVE